MGVSSGYCLYQLSQVGIAVLVQFEQTVTYLVFAAAFGSEDGWFLHRWSPFRYSSRFPIPIPPL